MSISVSPEYLPLFSTLIKISTVYLFIKLFQFRLTVLLILRLCLFRRPDGIFSIPFLNECILGLRQISVLMMLEPTVLLNIPLFQADSVLFCRAERVPKF
jgi:hypothetical protein